ncbi:hypothetical protein Fcan01_12973 [Folsomia candida]|uniref:Uncharacterized protein n=1 Tax=Folsomia candida TaxID=158441 RepID=A0A226E4W6_FOLCA|nr:hypothetical protein Fcan01_12973 [Folsomia candida]
MDFTVNVSQVIANFPGVSIKLAIPSYLEIGPSFSYSNKYPVIINRLLATNNITPYNPLHHVLTFTEHVFLFLVLFPNADVPRKNCSQANVKPSQETLLGSVTEHHDLTTHYCPYNSVSASRGNSDYFIVLTTLEHVQSVKSFLLGSPLQRKYLRLFLFWIIKIKSTDKSSLTLTRGIHLLHWPSSPEMSSESLRCETQEVCLFQMQRISRFIFNSGRGVQWSVPLSLLETPNDFITFRTLCKGARKDISPFTTGKVITSPEPALLQMLIDNGSSGYCFSNVMFGYQPNFAICIDDPLAEFIVSDVVYTHLDSYNFITCDGVEIEPTWKVYMRPFDLYTWLALFVTVLCVSLLLRRGLKLTTILSKIQLVFLVLDQGVDISFKYKKKDIGSKGTDFVVDMTVTRVLLIIWLAAALTLSSGYKGCLLSYFGHPSRSTLVHEKVLDLENFTLFSSNQLGFFRKSFALKERLYSTQFSLTWGKLRHHFIFTLKEDREAERLFLLMGRINVSPTLSRSADLLVTGVDLVKECNKSGVIVRNEIIKEELSLGNKFRPRTHQIPFMMGSDSFLRYEKSFSFTAHSDGYISNRFRWLLDTGLIEIWSRWVANRRNIHNDLIENIENKVSDLLEHILALSWLCSIILSLSLILFVLELFRKRFDNIRSVNF